LLRLGFVAHAGNGLANLRSNETKKMRSLSQNEPINVISATDSMKYSVPVLLLALALASGCALFPTKSKTKALKESPPAAEVENEFRDRWINQRVHDLMVAGNAKTEVEAKAMASAEFVKKFPYIRLHPAKAGQ
jgi:hypothetical protein